MPFKFISSQAIKSDKQRALASHWDRLTADRRFPAFTEFLPEPGVRSEAACGLEYRRRRPPAEIQSAVPGRKRHGGVQLGVGRQDHGAGCSDVTQAGYARRGQRICIERLPRIYDHFHDRCQ